MYIFKSSGQYFGFIHGDYIFDRDGKYIGWRNGINVWAPNGQYKGQLKEFAPGKFHFIYYIFGVPPVQLIPRNMPITPTLPDPPSNESPIQLPVGYIDAL
jgi:hypothetical protein